MRKYSALALAALTWVLWAKINESGVLDWEIVNGYPSWVSCDNGARQVVTNLASGGWEKISPYDVRQGASRLRTYICLPTTNLDPRSQK